MATLRPDLGGGATVLLHDTDNAAVPGCWRAPLAALPPLVDSLRAGGLTVGPVREHGLR